MTRVIGVMPEHGVETAALKPNRDLTEEFFGQHNTECCSCLLL